MPTFQKVMLINKKRERERETVREGERGRVPGENYDGFVVNVLEDDCGKKI